MIPMALNPHRKRSQNYNKSFRKVWRRRVG